MMMIRCLVIDTDKHFYALAVPAMREMNVREMLFASSVQDGLHAIHNSRPNLIFIRCGLQEATFEPLFQVIKRLKVKAAVIPVITAPTKKTLATALKLPGVVDLIAGETSIEQIHQVISRAVERLFGAQDAERSKHYRAFATFVGITPTLAHRKILSQSSMGLVHNRSLRLAIEYWRKNPNMPIAALGLNANTTFSSREDEQSDSWIGFDLLPWEIAMFEAQIFYMAYWREAIARKIMPSMIPTLLQEGSFDLAPMHPQAQSETLAKIEEMTRRGQMHETLRAMGIALRGGDPIPSQKNFAECLSALDKNLEEVDRQLPHLTRPPEETGYENFQPDKATPLEEGSNRMAFTQRNRN